MQYTAPKSVAVRYESGADSAISAMLSIYVETVAEGGDTWDCSKIVEVAGDIAGMVSKIPSAGFTLGQLLCGIFG